MSQGAGAYVRAEGLSIPARQHALPQRSNDRGLPDVRIHRYSLGAVDSMLVLEYKVLPIH